MLLHMMCESVLHNGLCNNYSGIYLLLQLLTTISVTILHTTKNRSCQDVLLLLLLSTTSVTSLHTTKNKAAKDAAFCMGYQVETLCGNNMDCFKLWGSLISQWHIVLPQVTAHPATVNHTCYRTVGVHCVTSKKLSSRGLMSQQAHTSPLQNH